MGGTAIIITAEHGGNDVPADYRALFANAAELLESHRGWDPGSLELARRFAERLNAPLIAATVTRLLCDLNRKPENPTVFSELTRSLDRQSKKAILEQYHSPHRAKVESTARQLIDAGHRVLHLGVHSFTPELQGKIRKADIGFLYDPNRASEKRLCLAWQKNLKDGRPDLTVRRNYPYRGTDDGLTTTLRRIFPARRYTGVEIEVNQVWPLTRHNEWLALQESLLRSFVAVSRTA